MRGAACRAVARSLAKTAAARKGPATDNVANATFNVSRFQNKDLQGRNGLFSLNEELFNLARSMATRLNIFSSAYPILNLCVGFIEICV